MIVLQSYKNVLKVILAYHWLGEAVSEKPKFAPMEGVVTKSTGSWYSVRTANDQLYECRPQGKLRLKGSKSTNPVAVGDRVEIELEPGEEGKAVIKKLLERKNHIVRKSVNLSRQTQVIAANLDQAVLIATYDFPKTFLRFIDRFAVTAEAYRIPLLIVFNKMDLYPPEVLEELEFYQMMYADAGYEMLFTSVPDEEGLEDLKEKLKDKTSLLSGHSGVGKSTLINAIEPGLDLKTAPLSEAHLQGLHTTTFAEMFSLSFGGNIIDTPGIKGFGLVGMEKAEIGDYFPEIFALKQQCKFHDCLHLHEPGCAVKAAVEAGELAYPRYESYTNFIQTTEEDETYRYDIYGE